jgi:hypothetical protein
MPAGGASSITITVSDEDLYERIACKAYELYQQRGEVPGHALDDWLVAERVVQDELLHGPLPDGPAMVEADSPSESERI